MAFEPPLLRDRLNMICDQKRRLASKFHGTPEPQAMAIFKA